MAKMTLQQSPKFQSVVLYLKMHPPYVLGLFEWLFNTTYGFHSTKDCSPYLGSPEMVEATAYWNGEPGLFFAAISRPGHFLDQVAPGHWVVHNWLKHAPDFVKKRVAGMERFDRDLTAENWWKGSAFVSAVLLRPVEVSACRRELADEGRRIAPSGVEFAESGGENEKHLEKSANSMPRVGVREKLLCGSSLTIRTLFPVENSEKARQEESELSIDVRRVASAIVELTKLAPFETVQALEELAVEAETAEAWRGLAEQAEATLEEILAASPATAGVRS